MDKTEQQTVVRKKKQTFVVRDRKATETDPEKLKKTRVGTEKQPKPGSQKKKKKLTKAEREKVQRQIDKNRRKNHRYLTRAREYWPQLFTIVRPLAIGIRKQLIEDEKNEFSGSWIRRVLSMWCHHPSYTKALAKGGPRYGLKGPEGEVSEGHRKMAQERLNELAKKKRLKKNKKARQTKPAKE